MRLGRVTSTVSVVLIFSTREGYTDVYYTAFDTLIFLKKIIKYLYCIYLLFKIEKIKLFPIPLEKIAVL